jgi:hypothetical protein
MNAPTEKTKQQVHSSRKLTMENMDRFKLLLRGVDWSRVYESNVVDESFDEFWSEFSQLYELCFPVTVCKLNRNIHRINGYMTPGLLISRISKNNLHKNSLLNPTPENMNRFRVYRNLYNTLMRKSKAKYFEENLLANVKNPKKTWDLLKEATVGSKQNKKIDSLTVNGNLVLDQQLIAEEFNSFFTSIGNTISESVRPTAADPINMMPDLPNITELNLSNIEPGLLCDLVKTFEPKTSCDLDGISIKLLKHVIQDICTPLAHIFNLSIIHGKFPSKLKTSRTVPIFKAGSPLLCDNYRPISLLSTLSKLLE